jgi:outer membrane protein OmpA-like peptidoglycan-associated protein
MAPTVNPSSARRRQCALALGLGLGLAMAGCQSTPSAAAANGKAERQQALREAGFTQQGDEWALSLGTKLLFEPDADRLSSEGRLALAAVAESLRRMGIGRVRVEGHTDNTGSPRHNGALSMRRAETAAQELIRGGLADRAVERRGHGAERPVADNATPEGRAQNRRVVITLLVD